MTTTALRLEDVLKGTGGVRTRGNRERFLRVSTDSRAVAEGDLFWALEGPNFDGHDFVATALAKGAAGAVIAAGRELDFGDAAEDRTVVAVDDPFHALGDLAAYWRRLRGPKVVAITGSNGKTTTKELIARVLGTGSPVLVTKGNLNNLIGLPLTLLGLRDEPVAVLEMGMNTPGEIRRLAQIARPDVAIITQVAAAHLEGLGTLDGVAEAKWELFDELQASAMALLNLDDPKLVERRPRLRSHVRTFGLAHGDVHAENVIDGGLEGSQFTVVAESGRADVRLPLLGLHNVGNAIAAIAVGAALGVPLASAAAAVAAATPVPGRMCALPLPRDVVVLDDTYNANPASMAAALTTGSRGAGARRKFAALGEMRELGEASEAAHRDVGAIVARESYDLLVALGAAAQGYAAGARAAGMPDSRIRSIESDDAGAAASALVGALAGPTVVVVKGSRGARMERVVAGLREALR